VRRDGLDGESEIPLVGAREGRDDGRSTVDETLERDGLFQLSFKHDGGLVFRVWL
jgi:hypothetical protein